MKTTNLMLDIMKWSETLKGRSVTHEVYKEERNSFLVLKDKLPLKRDRIAIENLLTAVSDRMHNEWVCLAYVYGGKMYSVATSHRSNAPSDILSTELLIGKLSPDEWNRLEKCDVWIHSGKAY